MNKLILIKLNILFNYLEDIKYDYIKFLEKLLMTTYVAFFLLECLTWSIGEAERMRLETFEMWFYRRILKVKWLGKITNEDVFYRIWKNRNLLNNLRDKRVQVIGRTVNPSICWRLGGEKRENVRPWLEYFRQLI